jgi:hypothetical protein
MATAQAAAFMTGEQWISANSVYLETQMDRLRLLVRLRLLWLRRRWRRDAQTSPLSWAISDREAELLLKPSDSREEQEFYSSDDAAREISSAIAEVEGSLRQLHAQMEEQGRAPSIDLLAARFGLTPFERDVVLLCLAPEMDPSFERIFAYVQDDAARRFATPHLALSLFAPEATASARASFFEASPLRRWRLIAAESGSQNGALTSPIRLDERILNYLWGVNRMDARCTDLLSKASETLLPASHRELATDLSNWLVKEASGRKPALIHLRGRSDSGRLTLAGAVCRQAGLALLVFDARFLPSSAQERRETVELVERELVLLASGLFVDADELKPDDVALLLASLENLPMPLFVASRDRLASAHRGLPVAVARPDASSQAELWMRELSPAANGIQADVEAIVEQFDLGPSSIAIAAGLARNQAALRSPEDPLINRDDLWRACRRQAGPGIEQLARRVEAGYDWNDIVVPPEVLRQLREMTAQVANRHQVYQNWGFGKKLHRGRGITALFSGASGVGKTMAAEVIARELNLDLYRIDLAGVVSKYIGDSEKNLRSVFDAAESSGAILFFDEADALFGKRSEVKDSHDRYANIEINYLLQRMEDYRGLAILATNMRASMDNAFTRRLRFIVDFPFPDAAHRMEIWRKVFPPEAHVLDLNLAALSRLEIAGGNIRNIAVNAAFLAAAERSPVHMDHLMQAARREYAKMDRLILDSEFGQFSGTRQ